LVFSVYDGDTDPSKQGSNDKFAAKLNYVPEEVVADNFETFADSNNPALGKINWENSKLSLENKTKIVELVNEFREIFLDKNNGMGRYTGKIRHKIDLIENAKIPKQRLYRVPLEQRKEVERQIQQLLDQRIIEKSTSPFCAPIVLVRKKDSSWRFVVDYRQLNSITKTETYLIPNIQEIVDLTSGKTFYTKVDFKSGFHQIPLEKSHRERTAFQSDHLQDLRELFCRIQKFGMKLRLDKCVFAAHEIEYLGVLISKRGSRINPQRIDRIQNFPIPQDVKAVKSFLGVASYFRRFIENFAKIAAPLTRLTAKHDKFEWRTEHQNSFEQLKAKLISAPVLAAPVSGKPYEIHTDASMKAVAATLLQQDDKTKQLHPIAFGSRCINKHERNYSIIELEALAIVFGLTYFRPYVFGAKIKIITDHAPLCSLFHRSDLTGRLAKYQLAIMSYDAVIVYRPGRKNTVSDALSRYPVSAAVILENELPTLEQIREEQMASPYAANINHLRSNSDDSTCKKRQFRLINDVLYYDDGTRNRLVIPSENLQRTITKHHHEHILDGGHFGMMKTLQKIREKFYWKEMNDYVKKFVQHCLICQKVKSPYQLTRKEPLVLFPATNRPFQRIHSDVVGPLPTSLDGHTFIVIHTCSFTKYVTCTPIPNQRTETIAKALVNDVVCKFGVPEQLVSDRGSNYTSELFREVSEILGTKHTLTTAYHHQANGQVERYVKTVVDSLVSFTQNSRENWSSFLQLIVFAMNTSRNESTRETAFFLMFGRDPQLISDTVLHFPRKMCRVWGSIAAVHNLSATQNCTYEDYLSSVPNNSMPPGHGDIGSLARS
ncbi:integrase core domain protein, partial [Oesophagostomum dentatum]